MSEKILKQFFEEQRLKRKKNILQSIRCKDEDQGRSRRGEAIWFPLAPAGNLKVKTPRNKADGPQIHADSRS